VKIDLHTHILPRDCRLEHRPPACVADRHLACRFGPEAIMAIAK
jgi:hypothetical protein